MPIEQERIHLEKEQKEAAINALIEWFNKERDEQLGHLGAELLLRFMLKEVGPAVYNQGVRDAAKYLYNKVDDLAELEL